MNEEEPRVKDVLEKTFVAVTVGTSIKDTVKEMRTRKVGSAIVTEDAQPRGIVTEADLLEWILKGEDAGKTIVDDIMSKPIITISENATLREATALMEKNGIRRLLVVKEGKIRGMLTVKEIAVSSPDLYEAIYERRMSRPEAQLGPNVTVCEFCGTYAETEEIDGKFICENCKDFLKGV